MADHQHDYMQCRKESGKQRADESQKSEAEWEKDEQLISDMEKEVKQKRQVNALNQVNPEKLQMSCRQLKRALRWKELH